MTINLRRVALSTRLGAQQFKVRREVSVIDDNGISSLQQIVFWAFGIIIADDGMSGKEGALERKAEGREQMNQLYIHTSAEMSGGQGNREPDIVEYLGADYTVVKCYNYDRYGFRDVALEMVPVSGQGKK